MRQKATFILEGTHNITRKKYTCMRGRIYQGEHTRMAIMQSLTKNMRRTLTHMCQRVMKTMGSTHTAMCHRQNTSMLYLAEKMRITTFITTTIITNHKKTATQPNKTKLLFALTNNK